jgi:hypothetical protein
MGAYDKPEVYPPASPEHVRLAEAQLGFQLPVLLSRAYQEVADGGFGPGYGLFPVEIERRGPTHGETIVEVRNKLAIDPRWQMHLLPLCDWGCAIWSCLDCKAEDGPIVTLDGEQPLANTGHTLRSWLLAWLAGRDLWAEMFEPAPRRMGINPFTRQPIELPGLGRPRGKPWP